MLRAWLSDLHYEEYYHNFVQAGYDMPTITHMTPQDLTAIGISKPGHRKKLKAEIGRLNIHDGIPDFKPVSTSQSVWYMEKKKCLFLVLCLPSPEPLTIKFIFTFGQNLVCFTFNVPDFHFLHTKLCEKKSFCSTILRNFIDEMGNTFFFCLCAPCLGFIYM